MAPLRVAAVLLALAILVPTASAAEARGDLATTAIGIPTTARVDTLGLTLFSTDPAIPALELSLTDVAVQRIGVSTTRVTFPSTEANGRAIDERASYTSATATLTGAAESPVFALRSEGPALATLGPATMRGVEGVFLANAASGQYGDASDCGEPVYCLDVFGAYEIAGDARTELRGGAITLLLYGPTLRISDNEGTREFASGRTSSQTTGPVEQIEDTWVVLRATDATGTLTVPAGKLYAPAPTLRAPDVEFVDAQGSLRIGARDYRATSDDVTAAGDLTLTPGPVPRAATNGVGGTPQYATTFTTRVSGDVTAIDLNASPAFLDSTVEKAGFAALLALLVAGVAYAWQHIAFLGAALYTRLNKPDILDNEVRNAIYDIIRQNPGISAREVHRRSTQSWGTVVYHLRQLERHHLVVSRSLGRTRNYYENHGKYRGMEVQLACLQSDRALTLARAIAGTPGITQEQLATQTGYPQPTTSYYVRKLKTAGLIEEQREGRYARYVPHADLPRYIALSERPGQGAAPPTGVQA